jgi:uncharacterized protein YkuJ
MNKLKFGFGALLVSLRGLLSRCKSEEAGQMNRQYLFEMIGHQILKASLIVFPPSIDESIDLAEISIKMSLSNGNSYTLTTKSDLWTVIVKKESIDESECQVFSIDQFDDRMKHWIEDKFDNSEIINFEVFEITHVKQKFGWLIGSQIEKIKIMNINNSVEFQPHGIVLYFNDDRFLVSTSGHDGNTIQTNDFISSRQIYNRFDWIGVEEYLNLEDAPDW